MKNLFRAVAPGSVVLVAALALLWWFPEEVSRIVDDYALVVYGAGLALAWVFHRSRAFIALALMTWLDIAIEGPPLRPDLLVGLGTVVVGLVGVLGIVRDRGVVSRWGVLQALAASVVASAAGIILSDPSQAVPYLDDPASSPLGAVVWPGYPALTMLVAAGAFLGVFWGFWRYRGPLERALIWAVFLLMVAMHPEVQAQGGPLFLMAAGLTLTIGMVETSYVLAYQDELTGLPGRRALMQYLDGIQGRYAVAMVDVDHFKKFNDRHGHDVGDQVLKLVAGKLGATSGGAKAYRYGGEEFTLLFPGRTREDAWPHVEAVRIAIEQTRFTIRSWKRPRRKPTQGGGRGRNRARDLSVTVSIGLADTTTHDDSAEGVLRAADEALYRAKRSGRNQVSK